MFILGPFLHIFVVNVKKVQMIQLTQEHQGFIQKSFLIFQDHYFCSLLIF